MNKELAIDKKVRSRFYSFTNLGQAEEMSKGQSRVVIGLHCKETVGTKKMQSGYCSQGIHVPSTLFQHLKWPRGRAVTYFVTLWWHS